MVRASTRQEEDMRSGAIGTVAGDLSEGTDDISENMLPFLVPEPCTVCQAHAEFQRSREAFLSCAALDKSLNYSEP